MKIMLPEQSRSPLPFSFFPFLSSTAKQSPLRISKIRHPSYGSREGQPPISFAAFFRPLHLSSPFQNHLSSPVNEYGPLSGIVRYLQVGRTSQAPLKTPSFAATIAIIHPPKTLLPRPKTFSKKSFFSPFISFPGFFFFFGVDTEFWRRRLSIRYWSRYRESVPFRSCLVLSYPPPSLSRRV